MLIETMLMATLTGPLPATWPIPVSPPLFTAAEEPALRSDTPSLRAGLASSPPGERVTGVGAITVLASIRVPRDHDEFTAKAAAQLIAYQDLSDDWDGEGATAPSAAAIAEALEMLTVTPRWLDPPKPMVLPSGDVALYWDSGDRYCEIGFDGSGTYYAYATAPDQPPVQLDDIPLRNKNGFCSFPDAVLSVLPWEVLPAAA